MNDKAKHISDVRRKAALASAKTRRATSPNGGRRAKSVSVRPETCDRLTAYAAESGKTLIEAASEAIDHGFAHLRADA